MTQLNALMADLQYTVIACAIRKEDHLARYGVAALDPYMLSLDVLVKRFCFEAGHTGSGVIVAEKRDATLDRELLIRRSLVRVQVEEPLDSEWIRQVATVGSPCRARAAAR